MAGGGDDVPASVKSNLAWFMTFADLICLLLAFFVLMFSLKDIDQSRFKHLSEGFKGAFAPEEVVVWKWSQSMKESEGEVRVQNKDVLGYLDGLLRARLKDDPVWSQLSGSGGNGEMTYGLPAVLLFTGGALTPVGQQAATRLATVLRNWDNVVTLRVTAATAEEAAPLLAQAAALEEALVGQGMTILKQAEWRLPARPSQSAQLEMVVQGAK